jgi:hypothetical protein
MSDDTKPFIKVGIQNARDGRGKEGKPIPNGGSTSKNYIRFELSVHDEGLTAEPEYLCSLDNAPFDKCPSPEFYDNLSPGPHSIAFKVKEGDVESNVATFTWSISDGSK